MLTSASRPQTSPSKQQIDNLDWSDEEFDYKRCVDEVDNHAHDVKTLKYPPYPKEEIREHYPNKTRPKLFYGDVKTDNAKAYHVNISLSSRHPTHRGLQQVKPKPVKERINLHESIPVVSANLVMRLTMPFVVGLWEEYKRLIQDPQLSIEESLLPVSILPSIATYINEKYGFTLEISAIPALHVLEKDDYIEFATFVSIIDQYVDHNSLMQYEIDHDPEKQEERARVVLCHLCCSYQACNCKGKFPERFQAVIREEMEKLRQRNEANRLGTHGDDDNVSKSSTESKKEKETPKEIIPLPPNPEALDWEDDDDDAPQGGGSKAGSEMQSKANEEAKGEDGEDNNEGEEGDDDDDESDDGLPSTTRFRLKIIHNRLQHQLKGKVRIRHIIPMLQELQIPYFPNRIPKHIWDYYDTYYLDDMKSIEELLLLLITEETPERDPLDHLFQYPLPAWLKNEFKTSEILLFQHQFTLIDIDGGGSIDAMELQQLLSAFGSVVTVDEAQAIVDKYDIDGGGTIDFTEFMILIYKIQRGTIDMIGNDLAQALMEAKSQLRIFEEIEEVNLHPPEFVHVGHFGGRVVVCEFIIYGPPGSWYEGRGIPMKMTFHDGYPYRPPKVEFNTRIFHINIMNQLDGNAHMLHLNEVWGSDWSIVRLLDHVVQLLRSTEVSLLPPPFNELYSTLEKEYNMIQRLQQPTLQEGSQQSLDHPMSMEGMTGGLEYDQSTMASSRSTALSEMMKNKFLKLNRVETMHLSVVYLYIFDLEAYKKLALTSGKSVEEIEEERKKAEEEENDD